MRGSPVTNLPASLSLPASADRSLHSAARLRSALLSMLCLTCALPWAQAQHAPHYSVSAISPLPGGLDNVALAINGRGDTTGISGYSGESFTLGHAFVARANDLTDVGALIESFPRIVYSEGTGINNKDDVVGFFIGGYRTASGSFFYDYSDDSITRLPPLDGNDPLPRAINDRGQITGYVYVAGEMQAFLDENGTIESLNTLANVHYVSSTGSAINNEGAITGGIQTPSGTHVYLYRNRELHDLGAPYTGPGAYAVGMAINNHEEIAGDATVNASGARHAFLYRLGRFVDLGVLPGATESAAAGLNDRGEVVGYSSRPFLYWHGHLWDLNDLIEPGSGWVLTAATAINDRGEIVGYGLFQGRSRAFRLMPAGRDSDGDGDND